MKNIKIYDFLESPFAINEQKWAEIWNEIISTMDNSVKLVIDFRDMKIIISPFMRALLKPLYKKWIDFSWINFSDEKWENIYNRIIEEFNNIWVENIRELNV